MFYEVFCFQSNFNCIFGISQLPSRNSSLESTKFLSKYTGKYEIVNIDCSKTFDRHCLKFILEPARHKLIPVFNHG